MPKFLPNGKLSLEVQPNADGSPNNLTIPAGMAIRFTITRKALSSTQTGEFRIYGLDDATRNAIYKDRFDWTQFRSIQFSAGYANFTPLIFNGTILQAYSEKEGDENVVTVIEAFDGGFPITNGFTSQTVGPGTTAADVISFLGADLPGITSAPIVGSFPVANSRGEVLFGNTWGIIQEKSGGNATIDNGQVKALNPNEALSTTSIPLVSSQTGLIGVPRRSGTLVEFDMVFEPRMALFQLVDLESTFNPQFNGPHKIMGFEHRGAIGLSESGPNITRGTFIFFKNPSASPESSAILVSQ
jgi:hypothetical protein